MDDVLSLSDLFSRKWAMPVLASLWRGKGSKFVTLFRSLGASQGAMRATVDGLAARGWVERNQGYGHPMRPEYVLTERGRLVGQSCFDLLFLLAGSELEDAARSKWSMAVVYSLRGGQLRFRDIAARIPVATDRALAICLKSLARGDIVERFVEHSYPPAVSYGLTSLGMMLVDPLNELVAALR